MTSLPAALLNSLENIEHFDKESFIKVHKEETKPVSVRINPLKPINLDLELTEKVQWSESGYYLKVRPSFTHDPLFHAGCYYVQEAGSMFIEHALKQVIDFNRQLKVLDLCAAPGGKSTLINSLLNAESLLVANELIKSRADVLAQNLSKWGTSNTIVTNSEPKRFTDIGAYFDCVVVDAPCSGSGLFRKQPEAINEWSEEAVKSCGIRQKEILGSIAPALKQGGILIYSTCSYSVEENENIVEELINTGEFEYIPITINKSWGVVQTKFGYRFYPHLTKSEGFFCAVLRKISSNKNETKYRFKLEKNISKREAETLSKIISAEHSFIIKKNERFHFLNQAAFEFLNLFEKQFYFKKAGTLLGEIKGEDFVPTHELALSVSLNNELPSLTLDKENAIKYLKKEAFVHPQSAKGLHLIKYKNYGIGWAKLLDNRVNNYLPNDWKILR